MYFVCTYAPISVTILKKKILYEVQEAARAFKRCTNDVSSMQIHKLDTEG